MAPLKFSEFPTALYFSLRPSVGQFLLALHESIATLQMFTGVYGVSIGFPFNIYMEK